MCNGEQHLHLVVDNTAAWHPGGRLAPCQGWHFWRQMVANGERATHSWDKGDTSDPNDRCFGCGKLRREVTLPKGVLARTAPQSQAEVQAAAHYRDTFLTPEGR